MPTFYEKEVNLRLSSYSHVLNVLCPEAFLETDSSILQTPISKFMQLYTIRINGDPSSRQDISTTDQMRVRLTTEKYLLQH